ncbi:hypothetical protein [Actinokineospora fastidiosa]|nr:hypothetical protein [Actinokineospora fastidiosa]
MVGAQAIYLHTGEGDLVQPPMTTDADLAVDATDLHEIPEISAALADAGFTAGPNPGHWLSANGVAVDLMVVPHQSGRTGSGARGARLSGHHRNTARITAGLEPALVDHATHRIPALDGADDRAVDLQVAGPAALLIAKAVKVEERLADAERGLAARLREKDALDMFRLLQAVEPEDLVRGLRLHLADDHARPVCERGLATIRQHGLEPKAALPSLAGQAASGDRTVAPSFAALAHDLFAAMDSVKA